MGGLRVKVNIKDLLYVYEKEVSKNTKNKYKIYNFEKYKMMNIINIKNSIENNTYSIGKYNIFYIYEPKLRIIMSLSIKDRIVDHYISKYILLPKINKYLDIRNVASRKNMGMSYGIKLLKKYIEVNKKYKNIYVLKMDISKYFYSIDHNILKHMLSSILDKDECNLVCLFIDSTNYSYVNNSITKIKEYLLKISKNDKQTKEIEEIPYYLYGKGLTIGNVCSQILSIFYLSRIDYYIIHNLRLKYMIRYCDDIVILSNNKDKLRTSFNNIVIKLEEYKLRLNYKKSFITNINNSFIFCGNYIKVINNKTIIKRSSTSRRKIKNNLKLINYLYSNKLISFRKYFCSINSYKFIGGHYVKENNNG